MDPAPGKLINPHETYASTGLLQAWVVHDSPKQETFLYQGFQLKYLLAEFLSRKMVLWPSISLWAWGPSIFNQPRATLINSHHPYSFKSKRSMDSSNIFTRIKDNRDTVWSGIKRCLLMPFEIKNTNHHGQPPDPSNCSLTFAKACLLFDHLNGLPESPRSIRVIIRPLKPPKELPKRRPPLFLSLFFLNYNEKY